MKTKFYNLLFLLVTGAVLAASPYEPNQDRSRYTKEKKIKKEFTVNTDALLKINNSYGNLNITSWNQNRTVIEVLVKTSGNNEEKVAQKLDEITVDFDASAMMVSATTRIGKQERSWWSSWTSGGNNDVNMEINYAIKVPATNSVDLNNDYGGIYLNRILGQATISCDYGHMEIGELLGNDNQLSFDYTNNSTFGYVKNGRINADYSSFTMEEAGNIELNADYTKSAFTKVKNLNFACDYGNLSADQINNIQGRGDYLSMRLGKVSGNVDLNADYGSIKIEELTADAGNVQINTDYAGIKIGYNSAYHFQFIIKLEYAGLDGEDNFEIVKRRIESSDKYYEGYYGSASAKNRVAITSEYGGVTFSKK